jgi:negative regulator of flagellin synthesis FlgM
VTNKINGTEVRPVRIAPGAAATRAPTADVADKSENAGVTAGEPVQITGTARHLAALEQSIRDLPAVDEARVAAVKSRLAEGSYQVDPQRVADRLLRMNADLGLES